MYRNQVEFLAKIKTNIMKGTIKTLTDRGFGFIAQEGVAKDLFFHSKDLNGVMFDSLKVGDVVAIREGSKTSKLFTSLEEKLTNGAPQYTFTANPKALSVEVKEGPREVEPVFETFVQLRVRGFLRSDLSVFFCSVG